jgi:tetratricopeptide (TPR) repeat protein
MDDRVSRPKRSTPRHEPAPTTPDPIEIAMEAEADGAPPLGMAHRVLAGQERLIRAELLQRRAVVVAFALGGMLLAGVLGAMTWSAARAGGLTIGTFESPPDLQQQGFTGSVLAARLRDRVANLQGQTVGAQQGAQLSVGEREPIRVVIPNTGLSLDDVDRYLRRRLGAETVVTGDVVHMAGRPGALALNVRVGAAPGEVLTSDTGDLDDLLQRAAEAVYRVRAPSQYRRWLRQSGRSAEALALAQSAAVNGDAKSRAEAIVDMTNEPGVTNDQSRLMLRQALSLDPANCPALNELGALEIERGRPALAVPYFRQALSCNDKDHSLTPAGRIALAAVYEGNLPRISGEMGAFMATRCREAGVAPCSPTAVVDGYAAGFGAFDVDADFRTRQARFARGIARAHAGQQAARLIALVRPHLDLADPLQRTDYISGAGAVARELEDWPELLRLAEESRELGDANLDTSNPAVWRAYALARVGRADEARAAAALLPPDCYWCAMVRGHTARALRQGAEADRWFAEAARQAPDSPFAYDESARGRLLAGDPKGALAFARRAAKVSPGHADGPELAGEALLAAGDPRAAAREFARAAQLYPWWGSVHVKWGEALAKLGKPDEARVHWRMAGTMDLTPTERAELARVQGGK